MKAVTEFANFTLNQALKSKAALSADGKTPEEIQQSLGQTFKLEGEKLTYFTNAIDVAGSNSEKLKRVLVMSFAEGENVPAKAVKVGELYYIPEFFMDAQPVTASPKGPGGKGRGGRKGGGGPKGSPWGLSPEEKALKNKKPAAGPQ